MSEFKKLTDREHILLRNSMYIGSTQETEQDAWLNGKKTTVKVVPGLLKICNELIDNSIDEYIRSNGEYSTNINVQIDKNTFSVEDNGRGIPIEQYEGEWRPTVAWTEAKAGTSFSEHRVGPGANGVGSMVANVFSNKFIGKTCDGKNNCVVTCSDNMKIIKTHVSSATKNAKRGTKVYIEPDFKRFGVKGLDEDTIKSIRERITAISATYPITFWFNGEKIAFKNPQKYLSSFGETFVFQQTKNAFFGVFPSSEGDNYEQCSYIDGLYMPCGGTHESYITREICYTLIPMIKKKYKLEMKPLEVKNGLRLVLIGKYFPDMEFESQTKEKLTNSEKDVKVWLGQIDFEKIAKKIMGCDEIIQPIIQTKLARQLAAEKRAVTMAQKKLTTKVKNHINSNSRNRDECTLFIVEGLSALASLRATRNPDTQGGFPLKGKPMNTYDVSEKKILENEELKNLMGVIGLQFGTSDSSTLENLQYGNVCIMCDQDLDGYHLRLLVCNFLSRWKVLFTEGVVKIVDSPIIIAEKGKKKEFFYTLDEFNAVQDKYTTWKIRYIKGLGGLTADEYKMVINDTTHHQKIVLDKPECFDVMFSSDVDKRKNTLMG